MYRAIESAPQWGTWSTGISWALGSFEPDGCELESGEQVPFAYPEFHDIGRFFHVPICWDVVEDVPEYQKLSGLPSTASASGVKEERCAWIDAEERRVQVENRSWCGVFFGQCEPGMQGIRSEGRLDCGEEA